MTRIVRARQGEIELALDLGQDVELSPADVERIEDAMADAFYGLGNISEVLEDLKVIRLVPSVVVDRDG